MNLVCIPPLNRDRDVAETTWAAAAAWCRSRRALLLVDPAASWTVAHDGQISAAEAGVSALRDAVGADAAPNAAAYFPRLRLSDPLSGNQVADFAPCGAVAGLIARTDAQRGVWMAPAGLDARLTGVQGFSCTLTDTQHARLHALGLNGFRTLPEGSHVVWGARTLAGADAQISEWKYLPVRRLALFLEESLLRGLHWTVFEPNDEALWSRIRLQVGDFLQGLFQRGAFQGTSPREAYFVKCGRETTTQADVDRGVVTVLVGFAPARPAEFVVLRILQVAGQVAP